MAEIVKDDLRIADVMKNETLFSTWGLFVFYFFFSRMVILFPNANNIFLPNRTWHCGTFELYMQINTDL